MADKALVAKVRGLGRARPSLASKSSDQTRSSTTFSNDPDLSLAVEANAIYRFDMFLTFDGNDNIGIKIKLVCPSGTTYMWLAPHDEGGGVVPITEAHSTSEMDAMTWGGTTRALNVKGQVITGGTAGDVTLQWAAWHSGSLTLWKGSWMDLRRCD